MCGIAGILNLAGAPVDPCLPRRMIELLRHRGPDGLGCHVDAGVALGHARLSIIDLSGGQQPMTNEDGSLWITFNGEIFNYLELREELVRRGHRFATRSDTEVILHAFEEYGESCVEHFNGQWAFAIWDARTRSLFLSRDRLGVRPLFYYVSDHSFAFASEMKSILALPDTPREIDPIALDQIFTFWVSIPPRTIFKDIRELPPGHSMRVGDGALTMTRYWEPRFEACPNGAHSEAEYADALLELLRDATRLRPVGFSSAPAQPGVPPALRSLPSFGGPPGAGAPSVGPTADHEEDG